MSDLFGVSVQKRTTWREEPEVLRLVEELEERRPALAEVMPVGAIKRVDALLKNLGGNPSAYGE